MNKFIKIILGVLGLGAAGYGGYLGYEYITFHRLGTGSVVHLKEKAFPGLKGVPVQILSKGTATNTYRGLAAGSKSPIDFAPGDIQDVQLKTPSTPLLA